MRKDLKKMNNAVDFVTDMHVHQSIQEAIDKKQKSQLNSRVQVSPLSSITKSERQRRSARRSAAAHRSMPYIEEIEKKNLPTISTTSAA
jgi:hypothetical protein